MVPMVPSDYLMGLFGNGETTSQSIQGDLPGS